MITIQCLKYNSIQCLIFFFQQSTIKFLIFFWELWQFSKLSFVKILIHKSPQKPFPSMLAHLFYIIKLLTCNWYLIYVLSRSFGDQFSTFYYLVQYTLFPPPPHLFQTFTLSSSLLYCLSACYIIFHCLPTCYNIFESVNCLLVWYIGFQEWQWAVSALY